MANLYSKYKIFLPVPKQSCIPPYSEYFSLYLILINFEIYVLPNIVSWIWPFLSKIQSQTEGKRSVH